MSAPIVPAVNAVVVAQEKKPISFGNNGVQLSSFEDAFRFSRCVAESGWAPKGMEKPESILVALQHGAELGLPPMASLQNIAVINGRPGIYGDAALALVRASGLCAHFSEAETTAETDIIFRELQFAVVEKDKDQVKALGKALALAQSKQKTDGEDFGVSAATMRVGGSLEFTRFTRSDAKTANLWGKAGPWTQYPKRMFKFRARGFLLRDIFGDVLKGLRTVEELGDIPAERNVTPSRSLADKLAPTPQIEAPSEGIGQSDELNQSAAQELAKEGV